MDQKTISYYSKNAEEVCKHYESENKGISKYFYEFESGSSVLEIGIGSGRDLYKLFKEGYTVNGVDASNGMISWCSNNYQEISKFISVDSLPKLETINSIHKFDNIICSAVLMHLKEEELFNSIFRIRELLKYKGKFLVSIPEFDTVGESFRESDGRLYTYIEPGKFDMLLQRSGFKLIKKWEDQDSLNRKDRKWHTFLYVLQGDYGSRPISIVESIINKDRKVATYKLALIRALADLATNNYNAAIWMSNDRIGIPISLIIEKWSIYYWPIFESIDFIPQIQKESPTYSRPVAFRKYMKPVIEYYNTKEGEISRFILDMKGNQFPEDIKDQVTLVFDSIRRTLINGPIKHSGGYTNESFIFKYDSFQKAMIMPVDLWMEFVLMGAWIYDAAILRWAELTTSFSPAESNLKGKIFNLLTSDYNPSRDVRFAKSVYDRLDSKRCVWSDKRIINSYDVDHVIPYSLWHNNDLWNLLPTNSKVNNQKRDKLPTRELIERQKELIIYYWNETFEEFPAIFLNEGTRFTGKELTRSNWENILFSTFVEGVELTALKRGVKRWDL